MADIANYRRVLIGFAVLVMPVCSTADESALSYNRDIRPILADNCFRCHGPDAASRRAKMRLDERQQVTVDRGGYRIIEPGQPDASELIHRVTSTDNSKRMPPVGSGSALRADQVDVLRRWIAAGAEYQEHWAFIPPTRPSLPPVVNRSWPKNAIDRFVLSRLEHEKMNPSGEADHTTLVRRVTLDLTGLPPTLAEIEEFERDVRSHGESAYRRLIARLFASSRYGEKMAVGWMDASRFADTNGYFTDNDRTMWPWRDWVISAFNSNMPFDQFTIEQLAGDLLPNATTSQRIATGFNRNHMVNNETGIVEEEFRVEYVVDRVDTTATVWMGLTLGCARCHDHKYDPISQRDFFRFFSFFNNVPERGLSGSSGNSAPYLKVLTDERRAEIEGVQSAIKQVSSQVPELEQKLTEAQRAWEKNALDELPELPSEELIVHLTLDDKPQSGTTVGTVANVPGMIGNAVEFKGDACLQVESSSAFDRHDPFSIGGWIRPEKAGCVISKTDGTADMRGWDLTLRKNKAVFNLVHRWNANAIRVSTVNTLPTRQWQHIVVTYDGSNKAEGVTIYVDGQVQRVEINHNTLTGPTRNDEPIRIGRRESSASYSGRIDDVRIYGRELDSREVDDLVTGQLVGGILSTPHDQRSSTQKMKMRTWFIDHRADELLATTYNQLQRLRDKERQLVNDTPTTMVMDESKDPRETFLLVRGQYDQHGEKVTPAVPRFLRGRETQASGASEPLEQNRLAMARWLVSPTHPLTARVTVNRLWLQVFGTGIVKTVDDFGTQGEWPSHPELLDYLATELVESGWNIKHVLRLIVTSATYRQSSKSLPSAYARDHENRLLGRGPRFRMDAESLRDNALAISGLLVEKIGGPSVMPYQPAGLWEEVTYDSDRAYSVANGDSLYRRSLYTFWKRQSPPPNMLVFDAPTRETCIVQRSTTNTPLQALVLMNDPTFVEAARVLAERLMMQPFDTASERIIYAFRSATARRPSPDEIATLLNVFQRQHAFFKDSRDDATKLVGVGFSARDESLESAELAAWTTITSMILSLDETITKQ